MSIKSGYRDKRNLNICFSESNSQILFFVNRIMRNFKIGFKGDDQSHQMQFLRNQEVYAV